MILIVGGRYQGKRAFARETLRISGPEVSGEGADEHAFCGAALVTGLEDWTAAQLKAGNGEAQMEAQLRAVLAANPKIVICASELGCGIVPTDAFDRRWRECTGRLCCMLAGEATAVYRVVCGIGTRIA